MISRATVVWLVLLLGFSAALWYDGYQQGAPCRQWKAAHPGVDPRKAEVMQEGPDPGFSESFNPCTVVEWRSLPLWVKLCAIGWLISLIGFLQNLVRDIVRYWRRSGHMTGVRRSLEQQPPKL